MKAKICFWILFIVLFWTETVNLLPLPGSLCTSMEPFIILTIFSVMVMPKPVPLTPEERALIDSKREEYKNAIKGQ